MENIRTRVNVKLVRDRDVAQQLVAKPTYTSQKEFSENLVAVNLRKS